MKNIFLFLGALFFVTGLSAQSYMIVDSARRVILYTKNPEEKFRSLRTLDRFYYTTGLYDSSALLEKELYAIAKDLKNDTLMSSVYRAMGNRFVTKTDYNFGLIYYSKALEYATTDTRRAGLYGNLAYVYAITGNNDVALNYVKKANAIGQYNEALYFQNILYGVIYNNLNEPDSALFYIRGLEDYYSRYHDATLYSILLTQFGKAYELKGETELAEVYYKKALAFCKKEKLASGQIRHGSTYCDFLLHSGKDEEAKQIALENLEVARKIRINEGISTVAEILRKIYTNAAEKDSIIYYARMQIDYKDSVSNQKKAAEFQNLTFAQQLREIDEQTKVRQTKEERRQNIQYALIALGIITLMIIYLLLSRSFISNTRLIEFFGVIALLIVFEFLNLLLHPFLERITHHSPVLMLLTLVCIAALLVPLHHRLEKWATHKLVEKNKKIRLETARRTIQQLEKSETISSV
jgi:tetratricopeptide (TPR) repeat protein